MKRDLCPWWKILWPDPDPCSDQCSRYGKCESSKKVLDLDHYLAMLIWVLWWMLKTCTSLKGTLRLTIIEKYIFCLVWNILLLNFSEKHYQPAINIDVKRKEIQFVWVNALVLFATIFFPIAIHVYTFWSLRKNNEWSFIYFWYYEDFKINVNYIGNNNQNNIKAEEKMLKQCNE